MTLKLSRGKGVRTWHLRLACQGEQSLPTSRGFTLDIPGQAARACRALPLVPVGAYGCPEATAGRAWLRGTIADRRVRASYVLPAVTSCPQARRAWARLSALWTLPAGRLPADPGQQRQVLERQRQESRLLDQQRKRARREMQERLRRRQRENARVLAEDARIGP